MSPLTGLSVALGLPLAAILWYPDWIAPAALVGGMAGILSILGAPTRQERIERERRTAPTGVIRTVKPPATWSPGLGFGFSLFHFPPRPFLFLSLFRIRFRR